MEVASSSPGHLPDLLDKLQDSVEDANVLLAAQNNFFENEDELLTTPIAPPPFVPVLNGSNIIALNNGGVVDSLLATPLLVPPTNNGRTEDDDSCIENILSEVNKIEENNTEQLHHHHNQQQDTNNIEELISKEEINVPLREQGGETEILHIDNNNVKEDSTQEEKREKEREDCNDGVEEMECSSESFNLIQQQSTSKEVISTSEVLLPISPPSTVSDTDVVLSRIPSSLITGTDSITDVISREESENGESPDKIFKVPKVLPAVAPSGIASFSLSTVELPDNALSVPMNMLTHNFPKRHKHVHRAAVYAMHPYHRATCRGGAGVSVAKTLDLLKAVLQTSFNQELKTLCDDYLQIFSLAAGNINDNTNDHIPPSTLKLLVAKMLEEAQQGYQNGKWEFPSGQLPKNERVSDSKGPPMSTKKPRSEKEQKQFANGKRARKQSEKASENSRSAAWRWGLDKRRLDPGKWSTDKLNSETLFVLGVNVNKALGHAANRGKVYLLHPELFKYVCDGDDKTWLYDNKHLPVHGGKAFLLIYNEVENLVKTEQCYKDNTDILKSVQKLQRFSVPSFMENKMKDFVRNVQGYFAQENSTSLNSIAETK